eukprot:maker-scaffold_7-snap-gene-15.40-mRNA-1 protein AED:0.04 eAED:0.04 QI:124/0.5/0.33/1/1/1/3/0/533
MNNINFDRSSFYSQRSFTSAGRRSSFSSMLSLGLEKALPAFDVLLEPQMRRSSRMRVSEATTRTEFRFALVSDNFDTGASGKIFKGYIRSPGNKPFTPVAVKRMHYKTFAADDETVFHDLLNRERTALQTISKDKYAKKFITRFLGYYQQEEFNEHWLVLEHCDGGTLEKLVKHDAPPTWRQIAAIGAGIIKGLDAIHALGFIHHDIKPSNILLTYPGFVKLCDFGLASTRDELHALGTERYMSPEHMKKNLFYEADDQESAVLVDYGSKTDVWAAGIVLLEILLGFGPLKELRDMSTQTFNRYIARFTLLEKSLSQGSALGYFFFIDRRISNMILGVENRPPGLTRLFKRVPLLKENQTRLHELLLRPTLNVKDIDNNSMQVPDIPNQRLTFINKFFDFIGRCLMCIPEYRPSAAQLTAHPYISSACNEIMHLHPMMNEIQHYYTQRTNKTEIFKRFRCALTIRQINEILLSHRNLEEVEIRKSYRAEPANESSLPSYSSYIDRCFDKDKINLETCLTFFPLKKYRAYSEVL